jgi:PIN domain nuclease of toxin-antitoxin system
VRLLLDTHVLLWAKAQRDRLGKHLATLEDPGNELFVSAVTAWEIVIKSALGKLALPEAPELYVPDRVRSIGASSLAVEQSHVLAVGRLPDLHRDPFDRLLIAQADCLGLTIVTGDPNVAAYPVDTILV